MLKCKLFMLPVPHSRHKKYTSGLRQLLEIHLPALCIVAETMLHHMLLWADDPNSHHRSKVLIYPTSGHHPQANSQAKTVNLQNHGDSSELFVQIFTYFINYNS